MKDPAIWSRHFARDIARVLGLPPAEGGDGEALVAEITEALRYIPGPQFSAARNLARFLRAGVGTDLPPGWAVDKLREVRDYALFLRARYGTELPADESDEWSEEDMRDFSRATWERINAEDPWEGGTDAEPR